MRSFAAFAFFGSDDISTTDVDARITLTPTQIQWVKVVLVAYDTCVLAGLASGKPLSHSFINWRSEICASMLPR